MYPILKDASFCPRFCFVHMIAQFSSILRFSHIYCQIFRIRLTEMTYHCINFNDRVRNVPNIISKNTKTLDPLLYYIKGKQLCSPRFLCRPTALLFVAKTVGRERALHTENNETCLSNSWSAHFHVSWLSNFIFYQKPLYKSLHQSFFYSFITILPSESGVTLYYSTILP
jgi:hypothetical protein